MRVLRDCLAWLRRLIDGWSAAWFFLVVSGLVSLIFVFILPPFYAPDERTHFMKIVNMSYGHIKAERLSPRQAGAYLPAKYQHTADHYVYLVAEPTVKPPLHNVKQDVLHPIRDNARLFTPFENTAVYPPLAYIPQTIAVFVTRIFDAPVLIQLYAARLAGLACWLVIGFFAIRMLPFGKWAAVGLSLLPVSYLLAASPSNDGITFGLCLLFIATVLRMVTGKPATDKRYLSLSLILALMLGLCKQPYGLLTLLVLLIPGRFFQSRRNFWLYAIACVGGSLFIAGLWTLFARDTYIPTDPSASTSLQLHYILSNPLHAFKIFTNNLFFNTQSDFIFSDFTGLMHWVSIRIPVSFTLLNDLVVALLILIASPYERLNKLTAKVRSSLFLLLLVGAYAIVLLIYISFETVQTQHLQGLNSRYFLPFLYLLIPIFNRLQLKTAQQYMSFMRFSKCALAGLSVVSIAVMLLRFY